MLVCVLQIAIDSIIILTIDRNKTKHFEKVFHLIMKYHHIELYKSITRQYGSLLINCRPFALILTANDRFITLIYYPEQNFTIDSSIKIGNI